MLVGWLQGKHILDMFTIGVRKDFWHVGCALQEVFESF